MAEVNLNNPGAIIGHDPLPDDPRTAVLDSWRTVWEQASKDPKHPFHQISNQMLAQSDTDYLIAGKEVPRAPTPVEIAKERIEATIPDDIPDEQWDLLSDEMLRMAELTEADKKFLDQHGNIGYYTTDELKQKAEDKLCNMSQEEYSKRYWDLMVDIGSREYYRAGRNRVGDPGFMAATQQNFSALGKPIHDQLVLQAQVAFEYHKINPDLFAALSLNENILRNLAVLGVSINQRTAALSRLPQEQKPTGRPVGRFVKAR